MRRSSSGFHVRHARAVEDASPYGGRWVRCENAAAHRWPPYGRESIIADAPECGVWIGFVLRGRFVKRPYIRFSKLRVRRSLSGFHVRHARAVEDASPYGGRRVRCGGNGAAECNCICLHTKYKYNSNRKTNPDPATAQPRSKSSLRNTLTFKNKSILTARKKAARGC